MQLESIGRATVIPPYLKPGDSLSISIDPEKAVLSPGVVPASSGAWFPIIHTRGGLYWSCIVWGGGHWSVIVRHAGQAVWFAYWPVGSAVKFEIPEGGE